ncbi:hypothetical protein Bbelb_003710 [Branchiostoma belcheri]|nr:hypothetical protein Bbelb_003710 [Branchiostoma belcheri]
MSITSASGRPRAGTVFTVLSFIQVSVVEKVTDDRSQSYQVAVAMPSGLVPRTPSLMAVRMMTQKEQQKEATTREKALLEEDVSHESPGEGGGRWLLSNHCQGFSLLEATDGSALTRCRTNGSHGALAAGPENSARYNELIKISIKNTLVLFFILQLQTTTSVSPLYFTSHWSPSDPDHGGDFNVQTVNLYFEERLCPHLTCTETTLRLARVAGRFEYSTSPYFTFKYCKLSVNDETTSGAGEDTKTP